jgi:hypothetical protein
MRSYPQVAYTAVSSQTEESHKTRPALLPHHRTLPAIGFIACGCTDVATSAIATIERISCEHPGDALKEGGLNAMLSFLDNLQFAGQKDLRNSFGAFNLLSYSDAKILDSACFAVKHFNESFAIDYQ